jgi:transposase
LSAKELQRVAVISRCVKGDLACAGAAELLDLSPRQVKRLKSRYRQGGEAAMAHASRGRPSPRRLPESLRQSILRLARTRYRGFNDHHLCEKLTEVQGFFPQPGNPPSFAPQPRPWLAPKTPGSGSSPAPPAFGSRRGVGPARRQPP